jgi:hypothetical protein
MLLEVGFLISVLESACLTNVVTSVKKPSLLKNNQIISVKLSNKSN